MWDGACHAQQIVITYLTETLYSSFEYIVRKVRNTILIISITKPESYICRSLICWIHKGKV
jgi:hypothetical protein